MISTTQIDNHRAWFRRIMQKGYSSRVCRRFGLFNELIILIFGIAVMAFHLSHTTFSLSMTVIISGITFFVVHKLMAIYERYWELEEITENQPEELSMCFINKDQINTLVKEKPENTTSV